FRHHAGLTRHYPSHRSNEFDCYRRFVDADQPVLDRFDRQRRRDRLSNFAMLRRELHSFHASRHHHHRHNIERHRPDRLHLLLLSRSRKGRRQQHQSAFQHRLRYDPRRSASHLRFDLTSSWRHHHFAVPSVDRHGHKRYRQRRRHLVG